MQPERKKGLKYVISLGPVRTEVPAHLVREQTEKGQTVTHPFSSVSFVARSKYGSRVETYEVLSKGRSSRCLFRPENKKYSDHRTTI